MLLAAGAMAWLDGERIAAWTRRVCRESGDDARRQADIFR